MPVYGGEMLVLRLMNLQEELLTFDELGFLPDVKQKFRELIHRPAGLVIVSGAMGCGKSSTLYAALQELNTADKNWLTLDVYATI
jgi:general secretion pathway protein E/type IV pilus assembly protein PilB